MAAYWTLVVVVGLTLATVASSRAIDHAITAAITLHVPVFVMGFTVVAIGTDLPEIANSIAASVSGHGDVNVGDSIGSALAQGAMVVGLVPLLARPFPVERRAVGQLGAATTAVLLLGVVLMGDGQVSRLDGVLLVGAWALAIRMLRRRLHAPQQLELSMEDGHPGRHVAIAMLWLLAIAAGATVAVVGLTRLADSLDLPEYLISFLGLAIGTSLPELTVAVTAARRGQADLALGNALGASLADASLSVGVGPVIAPTAVTASLVVRGGLLAAGLLALTTAVLVGAGRHTRTTGVVLVAAYVVTLPVLVSAA